MDFSFSSEEDAIRDTARRFAQDKLAPGYLAREKEGKLDRALVEEMGGLGLVAPNAAEEHGGFGAGALVTGIVMEEISKADMNMGYMQIIAPLITSILERNAPELAHETVPQICAGTQIMALGLTEPGAGSDAANIRLSAIRTGDQFVLNGEKTSISLADQADQIVLFTRTGTVEEGAAGVTAFLVPLKSTGVSVSRFEDVGSMSIGRGSVFFDNVEIGADRMIGGEGMGFKAVMRGFDFSRALIGIQCLAAAYASIEETWRYITQRQAFGQTISNFQGVTEPLAEAETKMAAARLLCLQTLWLRDHDMPHTAEASMCKWWPPQLAFEVIHTCLQLHGHNGYSREYPHQQRLRDVMGLHIGDGTKQIQKMVIAREKLKQYGG